MKGHIRKRGERWSIVIDVGQDERGKRKQKWFSGYRTKKEAEKAMSQIINEINQGTFVEPSNETLKSFLETWLVNKKGNVRPTTYDTYYRLIKNHIVPGIGQYKLGKLNPVHVTKFYGKLQQKHLKPATIVKIHNVLKNALNYAVRYGFIYQNPVLVVDKPREGKQEMKFWNEEEAHKFLEHARKDRLFIVFHLAITTGMRQGEILGLRWKDIDFERNLLTVNQTLSHSGDRFQETKTDSGRRSIALSQSTIDELKRQYNFVLKERMKHGPIYQNNDLVVCTELGNKVLPRNVSRTWYRLLDRIDVPRIRFHDLRHTHATIMLKQGVHPKVVSERLGHSNVRITLDTYSHVLPGLQEAAAAKFEENFFKGRNTSESES